MNIDKAIRFMEGMQIRDKGANLVPFHLNSCQRMMMGKLKAQFDDIGRIRAIVLKARRMGISTISEGIVVSHSFSQSNAKAMVVAHDMQTAKELFDVGKRMRDSVPMNSLKATQRLIVVPHKAGDSQIKVATAGAKLGGRGLSLSALHLSETAMYPGGGESLTSLLSTVPARPGTIVIIESTAKGMAGTGEHFYNMWCSAEEGRSEFAPIFIPWTMDPDCVRDAEEIESDSLDEDEQDMVEAGVTLPQLAWRRWCVENLCHGSVDFFNQEYPWKAEVAFVASGNPAFNSRMLRWASKFLMDPVRTVMPRRDDGGKIVFDADPDGVLLWSQPLEGHKYYIGADVAMGGSASDFSAFIIWDGSTGDQVGRYASKIGPEALADMLDMLGRAYNNALINIEVTGGWGKWAQSVMRDHYHYPNFYRWKGRDDHIPGKSVKTTLGWETTWTSRDRLFAVFREGLAGGRIRIHDQATFAQIKAATYDPSWKVEIQEDHDDIAMAAVIGWIAVEDYPPPKHSGEFKVLELTTTEEKLSSVRLGPPVYEGLTGEQNLSQFIADRCARNYRATIRGQIKDRLAGI